MTGVEMWVKVFSPNVRSVEVVQRAEKRARRARLFYMRYAALIDRMAHDYSWEKVITGKENHKLTRFFLIGNQSMIVVVFRTWWTGIASKSVSFETVILRDLVRLPKAIKAPRVGNRGLRNG